MAQLLGKLKDRKLVETLVDLLPELPRGVRPSVGDALKTITGEDFGPREGDGVAELTVALKKWRTWLEANEKP